MRLQLRQEKRLQLLNGCGPGRARPAIRGLARVFRRAVGVEILGTRGEREQEHHDADFRAVHIYPNVKVRSRSRKSSKGRTSAGGTRKIAAGRKQSHLAPPEKNCNPFNSRRE